MLNRRIFFFALVLVAAPCWAAQDDLCSKTSTVSDVQFSLSLKNDRAVFQEGEIIPLALSFTSTTKNRYWADVRTYDRSGRLDIERYCVEPDAPDPVLPYFKNSGGFIGGGLGSTQALDATPLKADAELNEWRKLAPGHYRVYAISYRVWRPPDPTEQTPYGRLEEVVRSNAVKLDIRPASADWQADQLRAATQTLLAPASPEDARHAARVLRFLNTPDSTRQLAKLFWSLNQQPGGWDLMFGLYASSYRQLAIDAMREEFAAPEHAVTGEYLSTLVGLVISADRPWDPPASFDPANPEAAQEFWKNRQAHTLELMKTESRNAAASLPHKVGKARALTLEGLLGNAGDDPALLQMVRPALIEAWDDLPAEKQGWLIEFAWPQIASPAMLPILRRIVSGPPPPFMTDSAMSRDAALKHLYELAPEEARPLILADLQNEKAQPSMDVVKLLPPEDIALALRPAVERISRHDNDRELDYALLDRYADISSLAPVQQVFEEHVGKWACAPQTAMLRYFLRVAPEYGVKQVDASLNFRSDTHCYSSLFQELGDEFPLAEQSAIRALNDPDPELVQDAAQSLGKWGTSDAEAALWARLERFHQDWAGREGELRSTPDYRNPGSRGAALEEGLVAAIATGTSWICPPDKLRRLAGLVWTGSQRTQIENWMKQWKDGSTAISSTWFPLDKPTFSMFQYNSLTSEQLRTKLEQLPAGTQLMWQFWQPGQISPAVTIAKQDELYEQMKAVFEQHGVTIGKANHP